MRYLTSKEAFFFLFLLVFFGGFFWLVGFGLFSEIAAIVAMLSQYGNTVAFFKLRLRLLLLIHF